MDSSASGGVGPHELVEGDIRSPDLDLGDPRLCGADALAELLLGEAVRLARASVSRSSTSCRSSAVSPRKSAASPIRQPAVVRAFRFLLLMVMGSPFGCFAARFFVGPEPLLALAVDGG